MAYIKRLGDMGKEDVGIAGGKGFSLGDMTKAGIPVSALSLMACEAWDLGERVNMPLACQGALFFNPLFLYVPGKGISAYYDFADPGQNPAAAAEYFNSREDEVAELKEKLEEGCVKARFLTSRKDPKKFKELFETILAVWPGIALSVMFGEAKDRGLPVSEKLLTLWQTMRKESEGVLRGGAEALLESARALLLKAYKKEAGFLLFKEIFSGELPSQKEVEKRKSGFVYYCGELYSGESAAEFLGEQHLIIAGDERSPRFWGKNSDPGF
ncbi:MAG: hypothetical protein HY482_01745 [Candidatus Wildermuthbacteria bacterium]|nr:hypothetical protein [Candidatus Wildermuthbacteria bacterium]